MLGQNNYCAVVMREMNMTFHKVKTPLRIQFPEAQRYFGRKFRSKDDFYIKPTSQITLSLSRKVKLPTG